MVAVDRLYVMSILVGDVTREAGVHERVVEKACARLPIDCMVQNLVKGDRNIAAQITPEGEPGRGEPGAEVVVARLDVHRSVQVNQPVRVQLQEEQAHKGLGQRGNPERGVGGDRHLLERLPVRARPFELLILHDGRREPDEVLLVELL